jgi:hypothetical protein
LVEKHKEFVKNRIKDGRKKLSAAKSRYKKAMTDVKEKHREGNLKPGEGLRLTMSEVSATRNLQYHESTLAKLLEEAKNLGIDTGEGKRARKIRGERIPEL